MPSRCRSLRPAAEQGNPIAEMWVGVRANIWYEVAATSGDAYALEWAKHRDKLASMMTPEDISAAGALAAKCKAAE